MSPDPVLYTNRHADKILQALGPRFLHRPTVLGYRLTQGSTLSDSDVYESTSGNWADCPCPGVIVGDGVDVIWVRPATTAEGQ